MAKKMEPKVENTYLQEVLEEQAATDRQLKRKRSPAPMAMAAAAAPPKPNRNPVQQFAQFADAQPQQQSGRAIDYRIVGFWWWKSVIVPPNAYVVHTRRGHNKPIHLGKGISFRFNPLSDAFLVIPSAVQTILINARCICRERQGILVQAYVQWIIDDLETAYWKLDFSDPEDPMGIVNVQLREQAEAAIKDKVATLSIDEILSDKQPIIEELTYRLRTVAEGSREDGADASGLGLKIVTVQIKEAIVSSTRLWQSLQAPFRAERQKLARLAEIENAQEISVREREQKLTNETADLDVQRRLEQLHAEDERDRYNRDSAEQSRRQELEQTAQQQAITAENRTAQVRNETQLELTLQELTLEQRRITAEMDKIQQQMQLEAIAAEQQQAITTHELNIAHLRHQHQMATSTEELRLEQQRREIANTLSEAYLRSQLIAQLPQIAEHLPQPEHQTTTVIATDGQDSAANSLLSFLSSIMSVGQTWLTRREAETKLPD
ncbi:MAG: SPFH domain-containing protein [Cyanobacteria bacterium P01_G01_bin.54]